MAPVFSPDIIARVKDETDIFEGVPRTSTPVTRLADSLRGVLSTRNLADVGDALGAIRHAVTYRRITLEVREARPSGPGGAGRARKGTDGAELLWSTPEAALERALSSPARRIVRRWGASP